MSMPLWHGELELRVTDHQYRTRRFTNHSIRSGTQVRVLDAGMAMSGNHDQVCILLPGGPNDFNVRLSLEHNLLNMDLTAYVLRNELAQLFSSPFLIGVNVFDPWPGGRQNNKED